MYATGNPKTKKQLKEWVAEGKQVRAFDVGPFGTKPIGVVTIEGPHFPKPHRWYARVEVDGHGFITKVIE
jgi:hypothetical protein